VRTFTDLAHNLGLEVLLELHGEDELDHVYHKVNMVGINNRNLKTFEVDTEQSVRMAQKLGNDFALVAESGISEPEKVMEFKNYGFSGFLIGETFMRTNDPGRSCREFIQQLK
jgi:indole-3-glycerol phosphate synthase